jgi:hypothetical protein
MQAFSSSFFFRPSTIPIRFRNNGLQEVAMTENQEKDRSRILIPWNSVVHAAV